MRGDGFTNIDCSISCRIPPAHEQSDEEEVNTTVVGVTGSGSHEYDMLDDAEHEKDVFRTKVRFFKRRLLKGVIEP